MPSAQNQPDGNAPAPAHDDAANKAIDVEALADKVYRLMREDIRLARARGQKPRGRETR